MNFQSSRLFALIGLSVLALSFAGCGSDDPAGVGAPDHSASAARAESTLAGFASAGAAAAGLTADVNLATKFESAAGLGDGAIESIKNGAGFVNSIFNTVFSAVNNNRTRNGGYGPALNIPVNEIVYACPFGGSIALGNTITPLGGTYTRSYDAKLNTAGTAVAKVTESYSGVNIELELTDCGGIWGNVRWNYSTSKEDNKETDTYQYAHDSFYDGGVFYDGGATNRYQITFSEHYREVYTEDYADAFIGTGTVTEYRSEFTRTVSDNVGSSASCSQTAYSPIATIPYTCQ